MTNGCNSLLYTSVYSNMETKKNQRTIIIIETSYFSMCASARSDRLAYSFCLVRSGIVSWLATHSRWNQCYYIYIYSIYRVSIIDIKKKRMTDRLHYVSTTYWTQSKMRDPSFFYII